MTDLERLARAVCKAADHESDGNDLWKGRTGYGLPGVVNWQRYEPIVHALLTALRDPTEGMVEAAHHADTGAEGADCAIIFRAMIDHVLNQKE